MKIKVEKEILQDLFCKFVCISER